VTQPAAAGPQVAGRHVPLRAAAVTAGVALAANGAWELTQRPLYAVDPSAWAGRRIYYNT
jgi:hypothetical protein